MNPKVVLKSAGGWIVAEVPDLPGCFSQGRTEAEAMANVQEAIAAWLWADELKKTVDLNLNESTPSF